jgi:hypothetical protein
MNLFRRPIELVPVFEWVFVMRAADPEWFDEYMGESPINACREFFRRHPDHPYAKDQFFAEALTEG